MKWSEVFRRPGTWSVRESGDGHWRLLEAVRAGAREAVRPGPDRGCLTDGDGLGADLEAALRGCELEVRVSKLRGPSAPAT